MTRKNYTKDDRPSGNMKYAQSQNLPAVTRGHPDSLSNKVVVNVLPVWHADVCLLQFPFAGEAVLGLLKAHAERSASLAARQGLPECNLNVTAQSSAGR